MLEKHTHIAQLLEEMTLQEKLGQMSQVSGGYGEIPDKLTSSVRSGSIGSVINEVNLDVINELQRLAVEESRLGIPLLIGRDVIHGFKTIFPIPLGQAASWCPNLIRKAARVSALEAASCGINWTFSPMVDIARDPRWGRVAESFGEDPYLCSALSLAMMRGYQQNNLKAFGAIASCAKHFVGYGASESGRDYCTTNLPETELRHTHMPPFKALADEGIATFMSSFSDLNGIPASGNEWLLKDVLRHEWGYQGFVVSDWESVAQLKIHGLTECDKDSAYEAVNAGIDMEMVSSTFQEYLPDIVKEGKINIQQIDQAVYRILSIKFDLGLFHTAQTKKEDYPALANSHHLKLAKETALKSCVLLENKNKTLPLSISDHRSIAVIGPLADDGYEQLGTWIFDGDSDISITCLNALKAKVGNDVEINYVKGLDNSRDVKCNQFQQVTKVVESSDLAIVILGEESILSGEAHCRADINLPGAQQQLLESISTCNKPVVLVVLAGRPLTLEPILPHIDALLYCWHPGVMGGPAIVDLLFGSHSPSGKLPISFPRKVGQIPIYYAQKHSGKPATLDSFVHMNDIPQRAEQTSLGMSATHLDTHFSPLYPFGYGLSFGEFQYKNIQLSCDQLNLNEEIEISTEVINTSNVGAEEVVQLYVRDPVASVTRPIKELKGFQRIFLSPKESQRVCFTLHTNDLAFYDRKMNLVTEPGLFHVWIGGNSTTTLRTEFHVV